MAQELWSKEEEEVEEGNNEGFKERRTALSRAAETLWELFLTVGDVVLSLL